MVCAHLGFPVKIVWKKLRFLRETIFFASRLLEKTAKIFVFSCEKKTEEKLSIMIYNTELLGHEFFCAINCCSCTYSFRVFFSRNFLKFSHFFVKVFVRCSIAVSHIHYETILKPNS